MKQAVKEIVKKNGSQLASKTRRNMANTYTRGYSTGATMRSVSELYADGGMTVKVGPHTNYFPYLEYGTRFMSARPTLRPAFQTQSQIFINDLKKVMK